MFESRFRSGFSGRAIHDWSAFYAEMAAQASHPALKRFYQAGVPSGRTPLEEVPLVAMDFETTGLDANQCDIVSIGLVPMSLQRIRHRDARHWIVRPRSDLSHESVVIHGITHSVVDGAPDLTQQLDQLLEQLQGCVVVAHCCSIERQFLDRALRERLGEGIRFPMLDTMRIEAQVSRPDGLLGRLFGIGKVSLRLADCRARYHLPFYHPHHAQTDALACAELLQAQIAHHYSPKLAVDNLWC